MERGLFLDVVVGQSSAVLELFSSKNESLLVWRDAFFVLNLSFHVFNGIAGLHLKGDGFSGERFHENLHTAAKTEHQVERGLFLDVVVGQSSAVLELFSSENESLLVWRYTFFVLDLSFHVVDGVARLDLECDRLAGQGLYENLHGCGSFFCELVAFVYVSACVYVW